MVCSFLFILCCFCSKFPTKKNSETIDVRFSATQRPHVIPLLTENFFKRLLLGRLGQQSISIIIDKFSMHMLISFVCFVILTTTKKKKHTQQFTLWKLEAVAADFCLKNQFAWACDLWSMSTCVEMMMTLQFNSTSFCWTIVKPFQISSLFDSVKSIWIET